MNVSKLVSVIVESYLNPAKRRRTLFLLGPSGVGKSEAVGQAKSIIAKEISDPDFGLLDLRLSQFDPVDFRGVPSVVDGRTVWNPPAFFPPPNTNGIIFLDEITSAPPAVQAPAYQMTNDHRVGDYELPGGHMVIAAGNRASDRGVTFNLAAPLLNRMTLLHVDSDLDAFVDYALDHQVRPEVIAFVKSRPDYLNERDERINPECSKLPIGEPFATQRSWVMAQHYIDDEITVRSEELKGCVGARAQADFEAFLRVWQSMPSIDMVFTDPDAVEVPSDAATRYAVSVGVAMRITKDNFDVAMRYLDRLPKEFSTLCIKMACKRDASVTNSAAFVKWAAANQWLFKRGV